MVGHEMFENNNDSAVDTKSSAELLEALQKRADCLLADLRAYQECLQAHGKQKEVEIRIFKRGVESEVKSLNTVLKSKLASLDDTHLTDFEIEEKESNRVHALRSANLPFYEAVWDTARKCRGVIALEKRVFYEPSIASSQGVDQQSNKSGHRKHDKKRSAVVDIICDDGLEWIKVSTVTDKRLLFEMAKEGWEGYGDRSDSEEEEGEDRSRVNKDEHTELELVRMVGTLQKASQQIRVRFRHPRVQLVLPKVQEGLFDDVDSIIADIRSLGVTVNCGSAMESDSVKLLESCFLRDRNDQDMSPLLPSSAFRISDLTSTLNIDCTILLALISDISHIRESDLPPYPPSGHYHKAITRQIATENASPLLPLELYRVISGRDLVCTVEAAHRMREIVQTMGTDTEKQRASALLGEGESTALSANALRHIMQRTSCHAVPDDLRLPVLIVAFNPDRIPTPRIPAADLHVLRQVPQTMELSVINRSVFLHGWSAGLTTVTSNRSVVAGICRCIDQLLDQQEQDRRGGADGDGDGNGVGEAEFQGPKIYVCGTARSLIGKEKQGL